MFSTSTVTLVFYALFVLYFHLNVGVLRTICFLLLLMCYCFAHYLFSTLTITLVFCALFSTFINTLVFFSRYLFCTLTVTFFAHYLLSTFTITLVYFALFVFYFNYYVGVLRIICFILLLIRWRIGHYLFST